MSDIVTPKRCVVPVRAIVLFVPRQAATACSCQYSVVLAISRVNVGDKHKTKNEHIGLCYPIQLLATA